MSLLDGAYARLDRIEAKHTEFRERSEEWVNSPDGKGWGDRYLEERASVARPKRKQIPADLPPILSVIAGEAIYNLRSALDYLAHELVFLNKSSYFNRTQFPIDDDSAQIPRLTTETLKRFRPRDRAAIEKLQPYNGCTWTRQLRDLSNPDKHRELIPIDVSAEVKLRLVPMDTGAVPQVSAGYSHVERDLIIEIGFDSHDRVSIVLDTLHSQITNVLDMFRPEFQAAGL